jgi:hypothetical protein
MARLLLYAYLVAVAFVATAPVDAAGPPYGGSISAAVDDDTADTLLAAEADLDGDGDDDEIGIDRDDAVAPMAVCLTAPQLLGDVVASVHGPSSSCPIDSLFRPPRRSSV